MADNPGDLTSLAAIGDGAGGFTIEPVQVRSPGPGEVRVALRAAGLCHTDHASLRWPGPLVLGHEGAGVIESIGEGVAQTHPQLRPGGPVLLNWAIPCGRCPQCLRGVGALCERTLGVAPTAGGEHPRVARRALQFGNAGALGEFDPDFGDEDPFEVEADDLQADLQCARRPSRG